MKAFISILIVILFTSLPAAPPKGKVPWAKKFAKPRTVTVDDASRLNRTEVKEIRVIPENPDEAEKQLQLILARAHRDRIKVSIAGARHTMGGHTIAPGGIVIEMRPFNQLELRENGRILRTGSGALWSQILPFLDQHGLSVGVMQSNNSFSVGGSLSANCHGWQYNRAPIASTVESFRLMKVDGKIIRCSRDENNELFSLVLGGYGLFGIILDADLRTVPNKAYQIDRKVLPFGEAIPYYTAQLKNDQQIEMAYARLNIIPGKLFDDIIISTFRPTKGIPPPLRPPSKVLIRRSIFRFSTKSQAGKKLRWNVERSLEPKLQPDIFSRNQLLNEGVEIFENRSPFNTDILHEYFVPPEKAKAFIDATREIVLRHKANLLNVTIRSVNEDKDTLLRYADRQMLAFVMLFHQRRNKESEKKMEVLTVELIKKALDLDGKYYLPYRLHATREQFIRAYPMARQFFQKKEKYDPLGILQNQFYIKYGLEKVPSL
jgi:FAD/FMN-containing dehydrogenase